MAMDFSFADYDAQHGALFSLTGQMAAGSPLEGRVEPQGAVRIFTGAALPDALDSVVMQEDVEQVTVEERCSCQNSRRG